MRKFTLDLGDDIISICDKLDWSDDQRILFVLPTEGANLRGLDLLRLRRHADQLRREVGLVTKNRRLLKQAQALGLPSFPSINDAEISRRGWWRGRRRQERIGLPTFGNGLDSRRGSRSIKTQKSSDDDPHAIKRLWLLRFATILLLFVAGSLLYVSFLYLIPSATITLRPETLPIQATKQITAVPGLEGVSYDRSTVPARLITLNLSWKTEINPTGLVEVPTTPARGRIVFTNISSDTITIPAGSIVMTGNEENNSNSVAFQTTQEVMVVDVEGATAEVDVVALEPGLIGNVERETITQAPDGLTDKLEVRNPAPMIGGELQVVSAVSEADIKRIHSQVLQFLQAIGQSEMETQLTEREFLAQESLRVVEIVNEGYSHDVGERTERLALEMEAILEGTAVDTSTATGLVYEAITEQVTSGSTLVPDSIQFGDEQVINVENNGNVTFLLTGVGTVATDLALDETLDIIAGQEPDIATAYLHESLSLKGVPVIQIWPLWVKRMPYLARRIQLDVQIDE